ncbi:MAG: tetratricopeptide repeat protein, partial [Gammaproteobacteria bacterium]
QLKINQEDDLERKGELYKNSLRLLPDSAELNASYAIFLKDIRKDYDQAEIYYRKALELDPNHANIRGSYALFLKNIRKDYDQAEVYYRKALELGPNNAINNANYAIFLKNIRKDYDQAEIYCRKALELEPNDADYNSEYAGFLLTQGKQELASPYLEKALRRDRDDLLLEYWFYHLAHYPDCRGQAKQQIEALLQKGVRSPQWDLSANIERAVQDGYPDPEELRQIAARIGEEQAN